MKHIAKHQKIKNEKLPRRSVEKTVGKSRKVKNPILQTYFTSLLSLILCVSMFFGTSLAWFSSEVQSTGNEILIGTLKAELLMGDKSLSAADSTDKVFDSDIKWEPGYTALRALTVKNTGDLDFTYTLTLTDSNTSLTEEEKAIAENFVVYAKTGDCTSGNLKLSSFKEITESEDWVPVMVNMNDQATLADILAYGLTVYRGSVNANEEKNAVETFTIALHMVEGAEPGEETSTIMGDTLGLNVKLVAYQKTTGAGDLTNAASDAGTFVSTYVDLQKALNDGGTVILAKNLVLSDALEVPDGKAVTLDLNGYKLMTAGFSIYGTLTVDDSRTGGTINANTNANWNSIFQIQKNGSLVLESGTLAGCAIRYQGDGTFTMNGGEITSDGHAMIVGDESTKVNASVNLNGGKITVGGNSYAVYVSNGSATVTVAADMDINAADCGPANTDETNYVTFTKKETE